MDLLKQDVSAFFDKHITSLPLYEAFETALLVKLPQTRICVQKTQITFSNIHVFACVSLLRVRRKVDLPDPYIVVTLGMPYPLISYRVAASTEPYPGRWTTHIVISTADEIDDELLTWVQQAYSFSQSK